MTPDDFRKHLALYSADLSHWPAHLVRPALDVIRNSTDARGAFEAELKLDAELRAYAPKLPAMSALEDRIMGAVAALGRPAAAVKSFLWRPAYLFAPGGGLLAAALIGFIIGISPAPQADGIMDSVAFAPDQIVSTDDTIINEGDFSNEDQ